MKRGRGPKRILYDHLGNPIKMERQGISGAFTLPGGGLPPWAGAGTGRRAIGWNPSVRSPAALALHAGQTLLQRSRQEVRDNAFAESAVTSWASNTVGVGVVPSPDISDDGFRQEIMELWDEFVLECDADDRLSFYGLQSLAARSVKEAGEIFFRIRRRNQSATGPLVPVQLQMLEAEMLDAGWNFRVSDRRIVKNGVEFNRRGERKRYHFWSRHPGEIVDFEASLARVPISAGNVIHVFNMLRPGQVRGVPGLATVLTRLKEIGEIEDAALMREKVQNLYATFETSPDMESVLDTASDEDEIYDADDVQLAAAEPGTHVLLPPGHDVTFANPPDGASNFEAFMRVELRAVAAGCGATYEQLTGDLTQVNFSSIRAGLIDLYRKVEAWTDHVLNFQMNRITWREFITAAVLVGELKLPRGTEIGSRAYRKLLRPDWISTPGREYVDPVKEVKADVLAEEAGFRSRRQIVARTSGMDIASLERINAEDRERAERLGNEYGAARNVDPASEEPPDERAGEGGGNT